MKTVKKVSCLLIYFLILIVSISAAKYSVNHWEFAGWYGGGCYPNIEFDPNNKGRVYLVSDVAGIWKSDNAGDSWKFINKGLRSLDVALIAIAPSNSNILYTGTKAGIFISKNAGESWEACNQLNKEIFFKRPNSYRSIAIANNDPKILYIGTASGAVFYSEDSCNNWQILGGIKKPFKEDKAITAIAFSQDQKYIFASSEEGLARYSWHKKEWTIFKNGPKKVTDFFISQISPSKVYAVGQNFLFVSDNAGDSWNKFFTVQKGIITRVSVFESNQNSIIGLLWEDGWNGGVLLSKDNGKTWVYADKNMGSDILSNPTRIWARSGGRSTALKISPFNYNVIFRTDWWGVWRSDDLGITWKEKITGAPNTVGSDIHIDYKDNIYVATMDNGLLKSENKGKDYKVAFPSQGYKKDINGHVWRVVSLDKNGNNLVATSSPWGEDINQVLISKDGGKSFDIVRDGLPLRRPRVNTMWGEGYPRAIAVDPKNPSNIYLGIDGDDGGGLFISRNGGKRWEYSSGQPGSRRIYNALVIDPTDPKRILWGACGKNGGVYLSNDEGASWKYVFHELRWVFDMAISNSGTIYVAGANNGPVLYISNNQGTSWKPLKKFPGKGACEAICIDPDNEQRIAVSIVQWDSSPGGKVYLSENGGGDWFDITGDLPEGTGASAMAFSRDSSYLYITRYAGSVYKLKL